MHAAEVGGMDHLEEARELTLFFLPRHPAWITFGKELGKNQIERYLDRVADWDVGDV